MFCHRALRLSLVTSALLGMLCLGAPVPAQTLNEQFLAAVEAGEWQQAVDLIDQIVATDPNREEGLAPFREQYTQRQAIDDAFREGNWIQASSLMGQFVNTFPQEANSVRDYQSQLTALATLQTTVGSGNFEGALQQVGNIRESSPQLTSLMDQYRQRILAGIPRVGQQITTSRFALTVQQFQDVTRQIGGEQDNQQYLVRFTIQNVSPEEISLTSQGFGLSNLMGFNATNEQDAASVLQDDNRLQPIGTSLAPGAVLQTGLVYTLDDLPQPLYFQFGDGGLVQLR